MVVSIIPMMHDHKNGRGGGADGDGGGGQRADNAPSLPGERRSRRLLSRAPPSSIPHTPPAPPSASPASASSVPVACTRGQVATTLVPLPLKSLRSCRSMSTTTKQ